MSKLFAVAALAIAGLLLSGCSSTTDAGDERTPSEPTPSAAATPSPDPASEPTPSEELPPEETEPPEETPEAAPVEEPAPAAEPATEAPLVPETPVAPIEPLPAGPNDPFVPPPHGEPNPFAGEPTDGSQGVSYPQPGYPGPAIHIRPGVLRIGGSGYAANEMISVLLAEPNTDHNLLNPQIGARPEPVVVYTGPDGSYTFDIHVSAALAPGEYGIMTWAPNRGRETPGAGESSKRYLTVYLSR